MGIAAGPTDAVLAQDLPTASPTRPGAGPLHADLVALADSRLAMGLQGIRLPYVKFPRRPLR